jgi:hypothetical protein
LAVPAVDTTYSIRGQGDAACSVPACGANDEIAQMANADVTVPRIG